MAISHNNIYAAFESGDRVKGFRELKELAMQGDIQAQLRLGSCYEHALGTVSDGRRAAESYQRAAQAGNAHAMFNLAVLYRDGLGVCRDFTKALQLFTVAANQG